MGLVETQVSHLVANVTKKNYKATVAELNQVHKKRPPTLATTSVTPGW